MKLNQEIIRWSNYSLVLFIVIIALSSCNKDNDPKPGATETTVQEDKQNIQATFDAVTTCVETFKNGPAVNVLFREFLGLSNGGSFNADWIESVEIGLEELINLDNVNANKRFDINFYAGTYTYDIQTETWSKTKDQTAKVVFKFPSGPEESTNNATLTISDYVDKSVVINGTTLYLPKKVNISLDVDQENILAIRLNNVNYASNADFEIPVEMDLEIFMNPFTASLVVSRTSSTDFNLSLKVSDGADCDMGVDVSAKLKSDDYENFSEDYLEKVTVVAYANDLKVQSLDGIAELLTMEDPTENDINNLLDLQVLFKDLKIADLKWDESGKTVIIFYKDGTSEDTNKYYDGFVEDISAMFDEFFG